MNFKTEEHTKISLEKMLTDANQLLTVLFQKQLLLLVKKQLLKNQNM